SESVLVRLHYMVYCEPRLRDFDVAEIERRILTATRSWVDDLEEALVEDEGEERGNTLRRIYGDAFPPAYRSDWVARSALVDIKRIEALEPGQIAMSLYRPLEAPEGVLRAIAKYLRQAGTTFSDTYVEQAMSAHPQIAARLVELFVARFDPPRSDRDTQALVEKIERAIDAVESLDQDQILRSFLGVIQA